MITDDEVLRLFERADPALTDDAAPAIDAAGYLDALRTRSSTVDYIETEPTPTEPPTSRHRWLVAAAAAATVAVIAGGLVLASRDDDERVVDGEPGPAGHRDRCGAATGDGGTGDNTPRLGRHPRRRRRRDEGGFRRPAPGGSDAEHPGGR